MTDTTYLPERVNNVLTEVTLPNAYRIIPKQHSRTPLGTASADSRFAKRVGDYTLLYATPAFDTAFIEVVVRDRFVRQRQREILLKEVTERSVVRIATIPRNQLRLLDLRGDGCVRLGVPTDAVKARNHAAGRALGRAIYDEHDDVDGILFPSRLTGEDVYAVFDRGTSKLSADKPERLVDHADLPAVLDRHLIHLIVET